MSAPATAFSVVFMQAQFIPYTDEDLGTRDTTALLIDNPIEFTAEATGQEVNLPYAGKRGPTFTTQKGYNVTLRTAGITPAQRATLFGNTVATSGTTPNEIVSVVGNVDDSAPLGDLVCRAKTNGTADVLYTFYGVRFTNNPNSGAGQNAFDVSEYRGAAEGQPATGDLYKTESRETPVLLTTTP